MSTMEHVILSTPDVELAVEELLEAFDLYCGEVLSTSGDVRFILHVADASELPRYNALAPRERAYAVDLANAHIS